MLLVSPLALQAKSSTPQNPANNSFNASGRDKKSDELYSSYQQRRAGPANPNGQKAAVSAPTGVKFGNNRPPIKKITFHISGTPKKGVAPAKTTTTSSPSMGGGGY